MSLEGEFFVEVLKSELLNLVSQHDEGLLTDAEFVNKVITISLKLHNSVVETVE